ncbi:MAG: nonstructural protein [Microviridae sp.]|nr:MAG: nonstructural protein [Microviridae sp.]
MATLKIYAVKDNAVETFGMPMFMRAHGEAIRAFADEAKNPESQIAKHKADFDLYFLGYYDQEKGKFESGNDQDLPERIARGTDYEN